MSKTKPTKSMDMKNKTRTVVTLETFQRTVVRQQRYPIFAVCSFCGTETSMFSPIEFARLTGSTPRQIYRRIEDGTFHFIEETDGGLLICGNSAIKQIKGEKL